MKKILALLSAIALLLAVSPVFAKQDKASKYAPDSEVAAEDGVYDVLGHPELKVKVFVHKEKAKPGASAPALVCGLNDPASSAIVGDAGWRLPASVSYWLNTASVPSSVGGGNLGTIAGSGFGAWQTALGTTTARNLSFAGATFTDRSRFDGQNIIAWGRTSGTALGVTYVWYYTATRQVAEVDTIMNKKFSWTWNGGGTACANSASYDAQDILTHEIGHWYGLKDEYDSAYANNTMYGYGGKGEVKKNTLTTGDATGVQTLY